jgi:hypothetical protein
MLYCHQDDRADSPEHHFLIYAVPILSTGLLLRE